MGTRLSLGTGQKSLPDLELQPVPAGCLIEQEATEITESLCISLFSLFEGIYMHPLFLKASGLTHDVIGSAIEVHKDKGPGLLESIYEWCLTMELGLRGYATKSQDNVTVHDNAFVENTRFDVTCWSKLA
jgi:hypothetical protein